MYARCNVAHKGQGEVEGIPFNIFPITMYQHIPNIRAVNPQPSSHTPTPTSTSTPTPTPTSTWALMGMGIAYKERVLCVHVRIDTMLTICGCMLTIVDHA